MVWYQTATCIFNIFFWCISAKCQNQAREQKKRFVEIKPVMVIKQCRNVTLFRQGSVGTHIRRDGQYICQIVGDLFRCYCANKIGWHSAKLLQK